jgi:hypothetical protein
MTDDKSIWYHKMVLAFEVVCRGWYEDRDVEQEGIDAAVQAAGYERFGDEDDSMLSRLVFRAKREVCADQWGADISDVYKGRVDTGRIDIRPLIRQEFLELLAKHPYAERTGSPREE